MAGPLNEYGDAFNPTEGGYGVDISSQRQDELDLASLEFISSAEGPVAAVELGGGFGAHSIRMAEAGANVVMIDIADMTTEKFKKTAVSGKLKFLCRDFSSLQPMELPDHIDLLYSQRAIHYVPYAEAKRVLAMMSNRMTSGGAVFISANGWDTEYGKTFPDRDKPVEERFNFVTPEMQEKHGITHKIVTYKKEELAQLLRDAGFTDVQVTRSAFGNIKAMARKP